MLNNCGPDIKKAITELAGKKPSKFGPFLWLIYFPKFCPHRHTYGLGFVSAQGSVIWHAFHLFDGELRQMFGSYLLFVFLSTKGSASRWPHGSRSPRWRLDLRSIGTYTDTVVQRLTMLTVAFTNPFPPFNANSPPHLRHTFTVPRNQSSLPSWSSVFRGRRCPKTVQGK